MRRINPPPPLRQRTPWRAPDEPELEVEKNKSEI
jgi:hypothetical protein